MQEIYLSLDGVDEWIIAWEEYYTDYIHIVDAMKKREPWVDERAPRLDAHNFGFRVSLVWKYIL